MAFVNFGRKSIQFKIVYYGPAKGGKTTNLERIHAVIDERARGELTMLSTQQDRTLFFDFLPLQSAVIKGFTAKFQLYTVPGQVMYNQTRKLVLQGVDGVVFVADSQWEKMEENVESLANLGDNLQGQQLDLEQLPLILQYNKRDLPNPAPLHYMDFLLNRGQTRVPRVASAATETRGVFEALNLIARMTLADFARKHHLQSAALSENVCVDQPGRIPACSLV